MSHSCSNHWLCFLCLWWTSLWPSFWLWFSFLLQLLHSQQKEGISMYICSQKCKIRCFYIMLYIIVCVKIKKHYRTNNQFNSHDNNWMTCLLQKVSCNVLDIVTLLKPHLSTHIYLCLHIFGHLSHSSYLLLWGGVYCLLMNYTEPIFTKYCL